MSTFLILLAAGDGKRLNSKIPKPYNQINGKTLLEYALQPFLNNNDIEKIILVYNKKHKSLLNKIKLSNKVLKIIGGKSRQQSCYRALLKIKKNKCNKVLIHDAARPNTSKKLIIRILKKLKFNHAVVPVIKVTDASKVSINNKLKYNINRDNLKLTQTPQGFTYKKILIKHKNNISKNYDDDSAMFIEKNEKVVMVEGDINNLKITNTNDLNNFKSKIKSKVFFGLGFDIHRLKKGGKLYLGGIKIPFHSGLIGHSDGDAVLHSTIDALLGACNLGDIGKLFSDKNKKIKNIRSTILFKNVIKIIESNGFQINNIDINVIAEQPKIKKYSEKIINKISSLCKVSAQKISIKGKTTEKLGLIGKEKAIASEVIASVIKYD